MRSRSLAQEAELTIFDLLEQRVATSPGVAQRRRNRLIDSLTRDLEMLLNSRRQEELVPSDFTECVKSVLNYGVADLTRWSNLHVGTEQMRLCRSLEEVIRLFEPRLRNVSLRLVPSEERSPVLRFRLEARAEVSSERLSFDMGLKRDSGEITVLPR